MVEEAVMEGGGMPFVGGRVRLLPLDAVVVVTLLLSRFLFGLRLDPREAPNCLNRAFMRTLHTWMFGRTDYFLGQVVGRVGEDGWWGIRMLLVQALWKFDYWIQSSRVLSPASNLLIGSRLDLTGRVGRLNNGWRRCLGQRRHQSLGQC